MHDAGRYSVVTNRSLYASVSKNVSVDITPQGTFVNRKYAISSALAATAAAALGAGLAQAPAHASATRAASAPEYVVLTCGGKAVTRPVAWTPYCADYGVNLSGMHWTSWNSHLASGYGTVAEDDNYPDHASGRIYTVPARVTLWGSAPVTSHPGEDTYTRMTLIFTGQRPAVYKKVHGRWTATYPATQTLGF